MEQMKTTVTWLITMETVARDFYRAAAESFSNERELSSFLTTLADDESWHKELMEKALGCLPEATFAPPVDLDIETALRLEKLFIEGREKIIRGMFTKDELFDCIIETEFSEWNPIFLYTVNSFAENAAGCFDIAARVQKHEKFIRNFMEKTPAFFLHLEKFRHLPLAWRNRILLVDDEPIILTFLRTLFEADWSVETATNGREALDKLRYSYFDVIVSDISMQPMDGIALYTEAQKECPDIGKRYLFYSGDAARYADFFQKNNLQYLLKPATMKELKKSVMNIIERYA